MSSAARDYFYPENYYEYAVQPRSFDNHTGTVLAANSHGNSLTRLVLAILLRVGFVLVQIGSVPVNNVNLILLQNVVDFSCVTVVYFLTGFLIAYNGDQAGLVGAGYWIGNPTVDKNEAIEGWQAVVITSAIYTTVIVGRMHTVGYLLVGALLSGLVQPFLIHWAWTAEGWMTENELGGRKVVFKDYAGAGIVHVVGGLTGLIGCIILGRRILRLRDLDQASITAGSSATVFGGLLFVLVGLQGLCMNSHYRDKLRVPSADPSHAYVNNLLAASSCSLIIVALHFALSREAFDHWTVMRCVQGTIAGIVIVSAAVNDYSPQVAIGLGCLGGVVFYLISRLIFRSALEDYCNIVAVHFGCAIFGSILAPICTMWPDEDVMAILMNFSWQLICLAAISILTGVTMLLIFGMLECCDMLRNRSECLNHLRANAAANRGSPKSFLQRLFSLDDACFYLQPSSISSSTRHRSNVDDSKFSEYQTEVDKLEEGKSVTSNPNADVKIEENLTKTQAPGIRFKKARQVYTLSGFTPTLMENQGGTGESIDNNSSEIRRKALLGRKMKSVLYSIEEIDEEAWKESQVEESDLRNIENRSVEDRNLTLKENINTFAESKDSNESNYQLRRTVKLMNLYHEFIKEDVKIMLGPKHIDSSSSDLYDEDNIFMKASTKNIVTSNGSLVQNGN